MRPLKPKLWTKDFALVCFAGLAVVANLGAFLATMPLYVKSFGGDDVAVGLVIGVPQIASLVGRPFMGWAFDIWGRKPFAVAASVVLAVSTLALIETKDLIPLLVVRVFQATSISAATVAVSVMAVDLAPVERRGEGVGYVGTSTNIGMALAPAFGVWLIGVKGFIVDGFPLLFIATSGLAVLAMMSLLFVTEKRVGRRHVGSVLGSLRLRNLVAFSVIPAAVIVLLGTIPLSVTSAFLTIYVGGASAALFFFCYAAVTLVSRPFAGMASDRMGRRVVSLPGLLALAVGIGILSISPSTMFVIVGAVIFGFGMGIFYPAIIALTVDEAPARQRGAALGTYNVAFDLAIVLGAIGLGVVAQAMGVQVTFVIAALSAALGLVGLVLYPKVRPKKMVELDETGALA